MEPGEVTEGKLREVSLNRVGTQLDGQWSVGVTTVQVHDASEFDDDGGYLEVELADGSLESLAYTSKDDDTDIITVVGGPPEDIADMEMIYPYPAEWIKMARVQEQDRTEWVEARVIDSVDPLLDDGIYDGFDEKRVLIRMVSDEGGVGGQGEYELIQILGEQSVVRGSSVSGEGLPPALPTEVPIATPEIESVTGLSTGIAVRVQTPDEGGVELEYHVSTTPGFTLTPGNAATVLPGTPTPSTIYIMTKLPNGAPPLPDTTYYFKVIAKNNVGYSSDISTEASGQLNPAAVMALILNELAAGFILTGRIQIGANAYIDATEGIMLRQPNNTWTRFTIDGLTASEIQGNAILYDLTIAIHAKINAGATMDVSGIIDLNSGIINPTAKAGVVNEVKRTQYDFGSFTTPNDLATLHHGLCPHLSDANKWVCVGDILGDSSVMELNKTTAGTTGYNPAWATDFAASGIISLNGFYWVVGRDLARGNTYLYKLDSSYAKVAEQFLWANTTINGIATIAYSGTSTIDLAIIYTSSDDTTNRARVYTINGTQPWPFSSSDLVYPTGIQNWAGYGSHTTTEGDLGNLREWQARQNYKTITVLRYDVGPGRETAKEWVSDVYPRGMYWDTTDDRFYMLGNDGAVYHWSKLTADATRYGAYAWYDGNATNGTHESTIGSSLKSVVQKKRFWYRVSAPPPPEAGLSTQDAANRVALFAGTSATVYRLGDQPDTDPSMLVELAPTSGTLPKVTTEFLAVAGYGQLYSSVLDTNANRAIELRGDGKWRLNPLGDLNDTGWTSFTVTAGGTGFSNTTVQYARYRLMPGRLIQVQIQKNSNAAIDNSGNTTGDFANVVVCSLAGGTFPAAYLPSQQAQLICRFDDAPATGVVQTTGDILRLGGYPRNYASGSAWICEAFWFYV